MPSHQIPSYTLVYLRSIKHHAKKPAFLCMFFVWGKFCPANTNTYQIVRTGQHFQLAGPCGHFLPIILPRTQQGIISYILTQPLTYKLRKQRKIEAISFKFHIQEGKVHPDINFWLHADHINMIYMNWNLPTFSGIMYTS